MIQKRETCLYCGQKMESITAKKKFCSDQHRIYWNRENVVPKNNLKFKNTGKPSKLIVHQESNPVDKITIEFHPKSLEELKMFCPPELKGIDRSIWISEQRVKFKI